MFEPSRADVLIVADNLVAQFASEAGQRTLAMLRVAGAGEASGAVGRAWSHLAASLDLEPDEALSRLLGRRVIVVLPRIKRGEAPAWSMATLVSTADVRRILRTLAPAQRGVVGGRAVFTLEDGAYLLAVVPRDEAMRAVVIGPAERPVGFEALVRGLDSEGGRAWFRSDWPLAEGWGGRGGLVCRLSPVPGVTVRVAAGEDGPLWRGVVVAPDVLPVASAGWDGGDTAMVLEGSAIGVAGSIDAVALEASPILAIAGVAPGTLRDLLGEEPRRGVLRISGDAEHGGRVEAAIRTGPDSAEAGDGAMHGVAGLLGGDRARAPDFSGRLPGAVRRVSLEGDRAEWIAERLAGSAPELAWGYDLSGDWMAVSLAGGGVAAASVESLLHGVAGTSNGSVLSAGWVAPGPFSGLAERAVGIEEPTLRWLDAVAGVRWRTSTASGGQVKATFEVEMRPIE